MSALANIIVESTHEMFTTLSTLVPFFNYTDVEDEDNQ
jgi:hypothetical protein